MGMTKRFSVTTLSLLFATGMGVVFIGMVAVHLFGCSKVYASSCQTQQLSGETPPLAPRYYVYSPEQLEKAHMEGRVILYFWAPWCTTCTSLDTELQKNHAVIPEGVTVLRVDYDTERELKQTYTVVTQHTFVEIDAHGTPVRTWVGGSLSNFDRYRP